MTEVLNRAKVASLILLLGASVLAVPLNAQSDRPKQLGTKVMCMCGGCSDAAGKCTHMGGAFAGPCEKAQAELKEIDQRIASGSSDDLILQSFVQEYGPTVLISPPTKGFDLWAWLMPVVMLVGGATLVSFVVLHWRRRVAVASGPSISPELLARARHDMDGDFDD